jgi:hypothetical protein
MAPGEKAMSQKATLGTLAVVAIGLGAVGTIFHLKDAAGLDRAHTTIHIQPNTALTPPCEVVNHAVSQIQAKKGDKLIWNIDGDCDNTSITVTSSLFPAVAPVDAKHNQRLTAQTPSDSVGSYDYDVVFSPQTPPPPASGGATASPTSTTPTSTGTGPQCPIGSCKIAMCKDWPCY